MNHIALGAVAPSAFFIALSVTRSRATSPGVRGFIYTQLTLQIALKYDHNARKYTLFKNYFICLKNFTYLS